MRNPLPELRREGLRMIVLVSLIVLLRGFLVSTFFCMVHPYSNDFRIYFSWCAQLRACVPYAIFYLTYTFRTLSLRNVRACALLGQYGAVVWCEWLSVLSLLTEPRTRCRCSASNFPLSMTPSSSCPYLCLFSRPCSSSVAVQP